METKKSANLPEDDAEAYTCSDSGLPKKNSKKNRRRKSSGKATQCQAGEEGEATPVDSLDPRVADRGRQPVCPGASERPASKGKAQASESEKEYGRQIITGEMLKFTRETFPHLTSFPYFVPSLQFNSTSFIDDPHRNVAVQKKPDVSDTGSDRAENDVVRCLRHIADVPKPEPMFVLFNYAFDNYLPKSILPPRQKSDDGASTSISSRSKGGVSPIPITVRSPESVKPGESDFRQQFHKARDLFPTPADLDKEHRRGDFDTLVVSPKHGVIVIETKAVGYNEKPNNDVLKEKASFAFSQLYKSETVLHHLFRDLSDNVVVRKVLALPNVTRSQIRSMLEDSPDMAKDICLCVQVDSVDQAAKKVLCADDLLDLPEEGPLLRSESGEVTPHPVLKWWKNITTGSDSGESNHDGAVGCPQQHVLSMDVYEKIVSRLVGQYSRVTIESRRNAPEARTVADCIHLTGLRFGRIILRPDQLEILESQDKFVFLTGPPGSGKTLVLGLKAAEWAKQGNHVVIVQPQSVGWGTLVSWTLYEQVVSALKAHPKKSHAKGAGSARKRGTSSKQGAETSFLASSWESSVSKVDDKDNSTGQGAESEGPRTSSKKRGTDTKAIKDTGQQNAECSVKNTDAVSGAANSRNSFGLENTDTDTDASAKENGDAATQTDDFTAKTEDSSKRSDAATNTSDLTKQDDAATKTGDATTETDDAGTVAGDAAERVYCLKISKDTNSEQFVENLKTQCGGRPIRLIVDECPSKVPHTRLHNMLKGSHIGLQKVQTSYQSLGESLKARSVVLKRGSGSDQGNRDTETIAAIKAHIGKIEHLLKGIRERLPIFLTPHGKPSVTQSEVWKLQVTAIQETCQAIESHLGEFRTHITDSLVTNLQDPEKVLEDSNATMLEASGLLFNVETCLGDLVLSDIFLAVRSQHAEQVDISVWSSGVLPSYQPEGFVQKHMSQCIRCPPRVQKVLEQTQVDMNDHPSYTYQCSSIKGNAFPLPTDGPEVKLLDHSGHMTKAKDINDCSDCGEALADYIQQTLRDGCGSGLCLEDIIIIGSFDISGINCEFLQALSRRGVAMEYEKSSLTTPPPYQGKAFVIGGSAVQGLEAKIVVFIPEVSRISVASGDADQKQFRPDLPPWLRGLGRWNRCHLWFVASRCLSQLVVFRV